MKKNISIIRALFATKKIKNQRGKAKAKQKYKDNKNSTLTNKK